jgi:tRNA pseudouridine55 synthase
MDTKIVTAEPMNSPAFENAPAKEVSKDSPREKRTPFTHTKSPKYDVHGWIVLDKSLHMTSTHAVAVVKRLTQAKKAGHAGTLDPLATGILPIALGDATKTVPFIMDGQKTYLFTVTWGTQTTTDDGEGQPLHTSDKRPSQAEVEALLSGFTGHIQQIPPRFSAIKVEGERAYDLSRAGEIVELNAREVHVVSLTILSHEPNATVFEAHCGKGTYVRSLARDMGEILGCYGYISALRRTAVGPFTLEDAVNVPALEEAPLKALHPTVRAVAGLPSLNVSAQAAGRIRRGQSCIIRDPSAPLTAETVCALEGPHLIAIGSVEGGEFLPRRVFR